MKLACVFTIISSLITSIPIAAIEEKDLASGGARLSIEQKLSIAETQHEIARLLIKNGQFDRVLQEMRKILDLNLPLEYEEAVAKSVSFIAYLLTENRQYAIGHELLDETLVRLHSPQNAASILKVKAYVYKNEGRLAKAIETLERAVQMEKQGTDF